MLRKRRNLTCPGHEERLNLGKKHHHQANQPSDGLRERRGSNNEERNVPDDISDDDVVIIDEKGQRLANLDMEERKKARGGSGGSDDGPQQLCVFQRQVITEHDYKTLAASEYLNDAVINFYLTYLFEQLPQNAKELVHIFSSHFYSGLNVKRSSKMKTGEEGQIRQSQAEWSYERVKSWTKKVDVFSKRMLVFPICEDEHWYLVIVCNPGLVLSQKRKNNFEKARKEQRESEGSNPFMMILDSLSGTHSTASNKIRSYLQLEHLEKKRYPLTFGKEKMNEKYPKIPLQPNSCDCGLFLLHYLELIFKDPTAFLGASLPDLSKWFTEKEIDYKRYDIAVIIRKLAAKESDVAFPRIMFPAKRRKEEIEVRKRRSEDEKATPGRQKHKATRQPRTPLACDSSNYSSSPSPPPPKKGPQTTGGHRSRRTKESESTSNLLSHFPQFLGGDFDEERRCPAVANSSSTSLRRKFFLSRGVESRGNENDVINSKSEMMEELMKGCR